MFATRCRRIKHLAVRREVETPGVAGAGSDLLEHRAVGFESNDPRRNAAKRFRAIAGFRITRAVADGAVKPAVTSPAHIVDHGVRIARAEPGVKFFDFVSLAVAIRSEEHTSELQSRLHLVC